MATDTTRAWHLRSRPSGKPTADNSSSGAPLAELGEGRCGSGTRGFRSIPTCAGG